MNFLRNTLGVLLGLAVSALIIGLAIRINPEWVTYDKFLPFQHWAKFLESVSQEKGFFWFLIPTIGVASILGGVVTALVVKYAKVAYAMLTGLLLLSLAVLDILIFPYHPWFYKIAVIFIYFPCAWLGGKIVEYILDRAEKRRLSRKLNL